MENEKDIKIETDEDGELDDNNIKAGARTLGKAIKDRQRY